MKKRKVKLKRKIKDTVFTALFKIPKYKLQLYKALNPNEKDVIEKDIKTITLSTMLSNGQYNDLGLLVKDRILFLMEAQSTWSINILLRLYMYLADTYKKLIKERQCNLYGSKKIDIPKPELYVIYLGKTKIGKKEFSLNEEYFEGKGPIELRVKVITERSKKDILKEYIQFSHRCDDFRKKNERPTEKSILSFINKCIRDNILKEFLSEHKEEIMSIQTMLFDQDYVTKMYEHELIEEGREKGRVEGRVEGRIEGEAFGLKKGRINILDSLVKQGILTKAEAKRQLEMV